MVTDPSSPESPTDAQSAAKGIPFCTGYDPVAQKLTLRHADHIPAELYDFAKTYGVSVLDASDCQLTELPTDFAKGVGKNLTAAYFSNNRFTTFPAELHDCPKLAAIAFKSCGMEVIPEHALPPKLRWLMLTDNQIKALPDSIGELKDLEKVALVGNQLSSLPESMQRCEKIALLRLCANAFETAPPDWIKQLPNLTWYSDTGNPFRPTPETECKDMAASSLTIGKDVLGSSPSSEVFSATDASGKKLAVKIYRNSITSDGWPADDMRLSLAAGQHPNIMPILGRVTGLPEGKQALVMELIPQGWHPLGNPPTLATVSRDSYPEGRHFARPFIVPVLLGVAQALQHLHARNIAHGDLYAHNIMTDEKEHAILGDFGAATIYPPTEKSFREGLDVRAFGFLMDDLLSRCVLSADNPVIHELLELQADCLSADRRPDTAALVERLERCLPRFHGRNGQSLVGR